MTNQRENGLPNGLYDNAVGNILCNPNHVLEKIYVIRIRNVTEVIDAVLCIITDVETVQALVVCLCYWAFVML